MLSIFQTLPHLVIIEIIGYIGGDSACLLWACHDWRIEVLSYLCCTYISDISGRLEVQRLQHWPKNVLHPPASLYAHLVKKVKCICRFDQIPSGISNTQLQLVFPNAVTLNVCLKYNSRTNSAVHKGQLVNKQIDAYLFKMNQVVPNVTKIEISTTTTTQAFVVTKTVVSKTSRVLEGLVGMAKNKLTLSTLGSYLQLNANLNPAHLSLRGVDMSSCSHFVEAIIRSSQSLRSIVIYELLDPQDISLLLVGNNGNYATYPNLEVLNIQECKGTKAPTLFGTPSHFVPFPNLKALRLQVPYPFLDDTPFRGNQDSLQHLVFKIGNRAVNFLSDAQIFGGGNYKGLNYVGLTAYPESSPNMNYILLIVNTAQHALVLDIEYEDLWELPINDFVLQFDARLRSLRELRFQNMTVTLGMAMDILSALPNLHTLGCLIIGMDSKRGYTNNANYLKELKKSYSLVNSSLRCLELTGSMQFVDLSVSRAVLTLSILCSDLGIVKILNSKLRISLTCTVEKLLGQKIYMDYKDKSLKIININ